MMRTAIASVLLAGAVARAADTSLPPVVFDSFEYAGRDVAFEQALPEGHYRNPILAGFYPDPSICRVGDDYYLINSTFAYFPGIPIFHSRDLVNWTQLGHVIHRPTQLNYEGLGVSRGIFAPAISHHAGTFYVVCTMVDAGGNFLVTAENPSGPWSDPVWLDFEGIDPSLFFDDDGRAWIVNNGAPAETPRYEGHRAIWIQEFDWKARKLVGPRSVLVNGGVDISQKPVWIEGPHLYKRDGWYYLCCAEGGTAEDHRQVILRSRTLAGPFEPWSENPILTQRDLDGTAPLAVTSTGHADLEIGPDGNWWAVFLACRPYSDGYYATGRETFLLPVQWTADGWPRILPRGERVPYVVAAPANARSEGEAMERTLTVPLTGNFTWKDEFDAADLSPLWIMLRAPEETWWSLDQTRGVLMLAPREETLDGTGNPSFLGRRLQHLKFEAGLTLQVPEGTGVSGGLAVFQGEKHHYYCGVQRTAAGARVFLERWNGTLHEVLAEADLGSVSEVSLRVTGDEAVCAFAIATPGGAWHMLAPRVDATLLTTKVAGGFVGAVVGPHARVEK